MLNTFICGSGSFRHEDRDPEDDEAWKKSRKNKNKNPYSTRGLDKFSALRADLEAKRQRIYSQLGSEDDSLVRFVYSNSNDCVPIVVKLKNRKGQDKTSKKKNIQEIDSKRFEPETSSSSAVKEEPRQELNKKVKKRAFSWKAELRRWSRPEYYFPAAVILILVFLAVFGRSAAVLCTSLGWYLIPTLQGDGSTNVRRSMKKKDLARRHSNKNMVRSATLSPPTGVSARRYGHLKSF